MSEELILKPEDYNIKGTGTLDSLKTLVVELNKSLLITDENIAAATKIVVSTDNELGILYKVKDDGRFLIIAIPNKAGVSGLQVVSKLCSENSNHTPSKYVSSENQGRFIANNLSFIDFK